MDRIDKRRRLATELGGIGNNLCSSSQALEYDTSRDFGAVNVVKSSLVTNRNLDLPNKLQLNTSNSQQRIHGDKTKLQTAFLKSLSRIIPVRIVVEHGGVERNPVRQEVWEPWPVTKRYGG